MDYRLRKQIILFEERPGWREQAKKIFDAVNIDQRINLTLVNTFSDLKMHLGNTDYQGVVLPFVPGTDSRVHIYEKVIQLRPKACIAFTLNAFSGPKKIDQMILLQPFNEEGVREFINCCPSPHCTV